MLEGVVNDGMLLSPNGAPIYSTSTLASLPLRLQLKTPSDPNRKTSGYPTLRHRGTRPQNPPKVQPQNPPNHSLQFTQSNTLHMSSIRAPSPTMPVQIARDHLCRACEISADHRSYLPEDQLQAILSRSVINDILGNEPAVSPEELDGRVDEVHLKAQKVLAMLIMMNDHEGSTGVFIKFFLDNRLYDEKLPFNEQHLDSLLEVLRNKRVENWIKRFLGLQYTFLAPVFFRGGSYSLDSKCILPFVDDKYLSEDAFAKFYKIRIHANHQRLQPSSDGSFRVLHPRPPFLFHD